MENGAGRKPEALRSMLEILELAGAGLQTQFAGPAQKVRADLEKQTRPATRDHLGWLAHAFHAMVGKRAKQALSGLDQALALRPAGR